MIEQEGVNLTKMLVILVLTLWLTAEVPANFSPRFIVQDGDDITLPCDTWRHNQDTCEETHWLFDNSKHWSVTVKDGDRFRVMPNCSLVINKVSDKDIGFYTCRTSNQEDAHAYLFLITMTEKEEEEQVKLSCFVSTNEMCKHSVKWIYEATAGVDIKITGTSGCSDSLVIPASLLKKNPKYHELFSCKVTDDETEKEQLFTLSPQSTDTEDKTDSATAPLNVWLYIVVTVGLIALITTIIVITIWKRVEDQKRTLPQDVEKNLNSAAVLSNPETIANMADPKDDVSYAIICHRQEAKSKTWDGKKTGDSVTYSSVKTFSAKGSPDPDSLYASINRSNE